MPRSVIFKLLASVLVLVFTINLRAQDESQTQVVLDSPADNELHIFSGSHALKNFKWLNAPKNAVFEISTDQLFLNILKSIPVRGRNEVTSVRLPVGTYYWRVTDGSRGVSETRLLELLKEQKILLKTPPSGRMLELDAKSEKVSFEWAAPDYAESQKFEIASDQNFENVVVTRDLPPTVTSLQLSFSDSQTIFWRVTAKVPRTDLDSSAKPSKLVLRWTGPAKVAANAPLMVSPKETATRPENEALKLEWQPVEAAVAYRVSLEPRVVEGYPTPEYAKQVKTVSALSAEFADVPAGNYVWSVQALTQLPKTDAADFNSSIPTSTSNFELAVGGTSDRGSFSGVTDVAAVEESAKEGGGGYLALSTMLAPFNYEIVSPFHVLRGTTASHSYTLRLSGEYQQTSRLTWYGGAENTFMSFAQGDFGRMTFEAGGKYRVPLKGQMDGWILIPKAGPEYRDYEHIVPVGAGFENYDIDVWGVALGFDLRRQLTETLSLGIKSAYFMPLLLAGTPYEASLSSQASYRNFNFGAQGVFFMAPEWALAGGAFFETRSISYIPEGRSKAEEIYSDGLFFFGSFIYTFGT